MDEAACKGSQRGSRVLFIQSQMRLNRKQPERLHLSVQRESFPQVLRQSLGSCRIARHGEYKRSFALYNLSFLGLLNDPPSFVETLQGNCLLRINRLSSERKPCPRHSQD
jgi:hypothetical protein